MPRWVWLLIVLQLWIVYTYAAIAKLYPDWFSLKFPALLMSGKKDLPFIGDFLQQEWVHYSIAYYGFFFDLLIIPLLFWKRTRIFAFLAALFFHLFNSFVFHIGIFPYLALGFTLFFFPSRKVNKYLLWKKPYFTKEEMEIPSYRKPLILFLSVWLMVQLALPLRHWFFQDDVLWTEEGHRLSWRMMLRSKSGIATFKVVDKANKQDTITIDNKAYLSRKQLRAMPAKADMVWQFAQRIKQEYAENGKEVEIYVESKLSVNGRPYMPFIDPSVDLAAVKWDHFKHAPWILPSSIE